MRQAQDGTESPLRRRGQRILSSLSSTSNSSRKSSDADLHPIAPEMLPLNHFQYFTLLPLELQAHIFTFLPSKILHKTIARTSRYYRNLIESHTRRRILTLMSPCHWDSRSTANYYKAYYQRRPANVLVFEAQRPIDTLTTKHTLHFSHFSTTKVEESSNGSSTLAHFAFVPIERSDVRSPSQDSTYTAASSSDRSAPQTTGTSSFDGPLISSLRQTTIIPIVHANDEDRLFQRALTSSVSTSPTTSNRPFTDVARPMRWRETSSTPTQLVPDETQRVRNRGQGAGYEGFNATPPNVTGHWSEPIASSSAAYDSDHNDSSEDLATREANRRARQKRKPTYRFQLDPLDSFETWILSLTLQRKSDAVPDAFKGSTRPLRWEKRVAEGLDRVFRDWFNSSQDHDGEMTRSYGDSALHRASIIASGPSSQSMPLSTGIGFNSMGKQVSREEDKDQEEEQLEPKTLEFDGNSCTMVIQPHAVDSSHPMHPALTSMSSHHYLSNSSQSFHWHNSLTTRVEYTFHCESLTVNAARLLNVLEDVEMDVERARQQAKQRGAKVVAGSSGDTSWSYSTGDLNHTSNTSSSSVWSGGNRSDGSSVSVIVFGAVRD